MNFKKQILIVLGILSISLSGYADNIDNSSAAIITGTITQQEYMKEHAQFLKSHPELPNDLSGTQNGNPYIPDYITFMRVAPNPNYHPSVDNEEFNVKNLKAWPTRRVLPMTTTPLNQGQFGTCATFSMLGAIQAATQTNNYNNLISQSCTLQMATTGLNSNVWNGSWPDLIWGQLRNNGSITNAYAQNGFCNSSFPVYQPYGSTSQNGQRLTISMGTYQANSAKFNMPYHDISTGPQQFPQTALDRIKQEINDARISNVKGIPGYYPVISFYINQNTNSMMQISADDGTGYHTYPAWFYYNVWERNAAHSIVVYGYDDNVCVQTSSSMYPRQCGVLFLRNSWGQNGYNGSYLMTYSYFMYNFIGTDHMISFANINYN